MTTTMTSSLWSDMNNSVWLAETCSHGYVLVNRSDAIKFKNKYSFTIYNIYSLMEDAYVMRDPFTEQNAAIILGSHCSVCERSVCVSQVWVYYIYWA